MPRWDYKCPECSWKEEHSFRNLEEAEKFGGTCPWCKNTKYNIDGHVKLVRQFPVSNFELRGYGWAKDGYESSTSTKSQG